MLFRRLIFAAVAVGLVVGALLGLGEQFTTAPLIAQAEHYEHAGHRDAGHIQAGHDQDAWAPSDGAQRALFTIAADSGVAIGFALLLMVAMGAAAAARGASLGAGYGALWGAAGFTAVFGAPALGLSPEVPGTAAAALADRQFWWIATVLVVSLALAIIAFAPRLKKLAALVLLPLPYLYGAPQPAGSPYADHNPAAAAALEQIHQQFIWASAVTNLVFWLVLGVACGWAAQRWLVPVVTAPRAAHVPG
ncbi:CbtA family protein [Salinisphaera sp. SPP-AMP-43]|uniref:CbtA family protein n=1 Tax=Salinisphaera sp. SPP-AMP-43 TaxID=3121288 RepID=UPI003C6DEDFF